MCIIQSLCTMPSDCTQPLAVLGKVRNWCIFCTMPRHGALYTWSGHWRQIMTIGVSIWRLDHWSANLTSLGCIWYLTSDRKKTLQMSFATPMVIIRRHILGRAIRRDNTLILPWETWIAKVGNLLYRETYVFFIRISCGGWNYPFPFQDLVKK